MGKRTEFLYLSEQDMIAAGVLDAARCVDVCEEVFSLLAVGDYLMGGSNHNSHGMGVVFPKETKFPNMPVAGPDRRFVAMPGYLGGRFDVCGLKWYGSNQANPKKGLPRSVLTVQLNDKDTGEPLCLMSANLLSSARTGGVPAVASRYLARRDSSVAAALGCGPINRACVKAIATQLPSLKKLFCYDLFPENAQKLANWAHQTLGMEGVVATDLPAALGSADVVSVAASRLKPLLVENKWFKEGSTILITGPIKPNDAFWLQNRVILDNVHLHEAYVEEAEASPDKNGYYDGVIGGSIYRLIDEGKLPPLTKFTDIGSIINGKPGKRANTSEKIAFVACGMSVFDLGWGYQLYKNALEKGIGTKLLLWDEPYQE